MRLVESIPSARATRLVALVVAAFMLPRGADVSADASVPAAERDATSTFARDGAGQSERVGALAQVGEGVYTMRAEAPALLEGGGPRVANVGVVVGPRGVAVVGSGRSLRQGSAILDAVRRTTSQPIRLVILTHAGPETIFGAGAFQAAGVPVLMHRNAAALMAARCDQCLARLRTTLGEAAMAGTLVVDPDDVVTGAPVLTTIGRPLQLLVPHETSGLGWLAVLEPRSRTLFAGNLAAVARVPDLVDTDGAGWPRALDELAATRCKRLVPALGRTGTCADLDDARHYFAALDTRMRRLLRDDVSLAEAAERAELPSFAAWDDYLPVHAQNVQRAYLRLERSLFIH